MIQNDKNSLKHLIFSISLILFVLFLFSIKLFKMQIIDTELFSSQTNRTIYRESSILAERGRIYDRHYDNPLADNKEIYEIILDYDLFVDKEKYSIFTLLEEGLKIPLVDLINKYEESKGTKTQEIILLKDAQMKHITFVAENIRDLPGIYYKIDSSRQYYDVGSLSHILGYLGKISSNEYKMLASKGYTLYSQIGKLGLEKQYDEEIKGTEGVRRRTVDYLEKTVTEGEVIQPPIRGNDLITTIDKRIQLLAEKALGKRSGSVVVLSPSNGDILAMVSWPYYDNNFNTQVDGGKKYREYQNNPRYPLLNRSIQSRYAPASTFKIIMTAAILETGLLDPEQRIYCPGYKRIGRSHYFHCHRRRGHGSLNLQEAFAESCNVYYYTAGYEYLGKEPDIIKKYSLDFGFGSLTGIDIPGEVSGLVPSREWLKETRNEYWVGGDTVNMSIGQGYLLTTTLQVASAVSMICNDGEIMQPHLFKELRDPQTKKIVKSYIPEVIHSPKYKDGTFQEIGEFMRKVCTEGTGRYIISTKAVKVAGKTGTAEIGRADSWHSWFVSYAPYDAPVEDQVVVVVLVEADNEWEFFSGRATNVILQGIFADQTYEECIQTLGRFYDAR